MSNKEIIITEAEQAKWAPIVEAKSDDLVELSALDKVNMVQLLENSSKDMISEGTSLTDGAIPNTPASGTGLNPLLIGVLRRSMPTLMGTNWLATHTLSSPNGMIMAMHVDQVTAPNDGSAKTSTEVWKDARPDVNHSGDGAGAGMADGDAERLGSTTGSLDATNAGAVYQTRPWQEMAIRLSSINVSTKSRALKAYLTHELIDDMKNMYGINAKLVLQNILKGQVNAELDYEIFNYVQSQAKVGAQSAAVAGTFDFAVDADGRWAAEYYKHFSTFIDRECNIVGQETRRGKANFMITSPDVASALQNISKFDTDTKLGNVNGDNFVGMSFAGTYQNKLKVYVDPYATSDFVTVGFKGSGNEDAGAYFCPYNFKMVEAKGEEDFNPRIGVKMRYGIVHNPYAPGAGADNPYFRTFNVANLI